MGQERLYSEFIAHLVCGGEIALLVPSSAFLAAVMVAPYPSQRSWGTWPVPLEPPPEESLTAAVLSMAPEKRQRCRMNCQSKLHILLQTPFVWNIDDFWRWIKFSYLAVTTRAWLGKHKRSSPC